MSDTAEALGHVEAGLKFAYDHGWHELGYDPVETLRAAHSVIAGKVAELEAEARRFAGFYPEASDGRNTFVMFADKIAALAPYPERRHE